MNTQLPDNKYISKIKSLFFVAALLFALPSMVVGQPADAKAMAGEAGSKFNTGEKIMEHVMDAHSWHITDEFSIPLPVILYSSTHGFLFCCSNKFENGTVYNGYRLDKEHIVAVNPDGSINKDETAKTWDFSLTKNSISVMLVGFLLLIIFLSVSKAYQKHGLSAPKGMQALFEPIIIFIRDDVAIPSIGIKKYARFMPYLLTLFFFILIFNLLGLVPIFPGGANTMGNISITLTLATFTFIITMVSANKSFWAHTLWMPGVPWYIKVLLLTPLEILGIFLRPFTLIVRIFANILAGHVVGLSLLFLIFIIGASSKLAGGIVAPFSVAFSVFMMLLEVLVAFIQAYVFTFLSAMYFGMAVPEEHHH